MTFRQVLLSRTPMAMILVATREHYRGYMKYVQDIEADRALMAQLNGASYIAGIGRA